MNSVRKILPGQRTPGREKTTAALLALFAFFLCYYNFGNEGYSNLYYSAALRSMTESWHNFFYLSFDPGGFVNVDKPPAALWTEAAFVKIFGFHSWSILLPEALAAAGSVLLLFHLVKKYFGFAAATASCAILAVTPIFVAASRSDNPDAILVFVMLLAGWAALRAAETSRLRDFLLTAALVGLGFNTKMLVAYLILPACFLTMLVAHDAGWKRKAFYFAASALVLAAVSFCWTEAVDLTPATERPYVGSSSDNSEIGLAFGYNGLNRVFSTGHRQVPDVKTPDDTSEENWDAEEPASASLIGKSGPLRLLGSEYGQQIGWFVPLALFGGAAAFLSLRAEHGDEKRRKKTALLFWAGWVTVMLIFFSVYRSLTHRYYLNVIAPGTAALAGIGFFCMVKQWTAEKKGWAAWLLPASLLVSAGYEFFLLQSYPSWLAVLWPFPTLGAAAGAVFAAGAFPYARRPAAAKPARIIAGAALACLLVVPAAWSFTVVLGHVNGEDAYASPTLLSVNGKAAFPSMAELTKKMRFNAADPSRSPESRKLESYLEQNRNGAEFLTAAMKTADVQNIVIDTGEPVMAIGGFSGSNPILTIDQFKELVAEGKVRYFLVENSELPGKRNPGSTSVKTTMFSKPDIKVRAGKNSASDGKRNPDEEKKSRKDGGRSGTQNAQVLQYVLQYGRKINPQLYGGNVKSGKGGLVLYQLSSQRLPTIKGKMDLI